MKAYEICTNSGWAFLRLKNKRTQKHTRKCMNTICIFSLFLTSNFFFSICFRSYRVRSFAGCDMMDKLYSIVRLCCIQFENNRCFWALFWLLVLVVHILYVHKYMLNIPFVWLHSFNFVQCFTHRALLMAEIWVQ